MWKKWNDLPEFMKIPEVLPYWEHLNKKKVQRTLKRVFDLAASVFLLILFSVPMLIIAVRIKSDSDGPVLYRQERVTTYGRTFRIHKFRTMANDADQTGAAVTAGDDTRVSKIGAGLRKYRLDELPQLIDVIKGDMSLVGTRPEVVKYAAHYKPEYYATLLMPAGITSEASIRYKDEANLLVGREDADAVYIEEILPEKMRWNLEALKKFSCLQELAVMIRTVLAVIR